MELSQEEWMPVLLLIAFGYPVPEFIRNWNITSLNWGALGRGLLFNDNTAFFKYRFPRRDTRNKQETTISFVPRMSCASVIQCSFLCSAGFPESTCPTACNSRIFGKSTRAIRFARRSQRKHKLILNCGNDDDDWTVSLADNKHHW